MFKLIELARGHQIIFVTTQVFRVGVAELLFFGGQTAKKQQPQHLWTEQLLIP